MEKILTVCEAFGGGVFTYVCQLCNGLCDDFEIHLAYARRPQTPANFREYLDPRVILWEIPAMGRQPLRAIGQLRKLARQLDPEIIHLHSSIAGGLGRLAFWGRSGLVYTPHGYAHILMGPGFKATLYRTLEFLLGFCPAVTLTCCESEDQEARRLTRRTAWIETGMDYCALPVSSRKAAEPFTVYTLGRICRQKQPDLFNAIALAVPQARFLWIGDGPLAKKLTAPNLTVTGWKSREEALDLAQAADAFVLCSWGEAISMSLLESMYLGKLVLVSDVMGNRSVIQTGINGYVCQTAEDFAAQLHRSMAEFPTAMTAQAQQDAKTRFSLSAMLTQYRNFYRCLLGGKCP